MNHSGHCQLPSRANSGDSSILSQSRHSSTSNTTPASPPRKPMRVKSSRSRSSSDCDTIATDADTAFGYGLSTSFTSCDRSIVSMIRDITIDNVHPLLLPSSPLRSSQRSLLFCTNASTPKRDRPTIQVVVSPEEGEEDFDKKDLDALLRRRSSSCPSPPHELPMLPLPSPPPSKLLVRRDSIRKEASRRSLNKTREERKADFLRHLRKNSMDTSSSHHRRTSLKSSADEASYDTMPKMPKRSSPGCQSQRSLESLDSSPRLPRRSSRCRLSQSVPSEVTIL